MKFNFENLFTSQYEVAKIVPPNLVVPCWCVIRIGLFKYFILKAFETKEEAENYLQLITMKYWVCKDSEGVFLYCGHEAPTYDSIKFVENEENYEWVEEKYLKLLHIKYPESLKEGDCIRLHLNPKSNWNDKGTDLSCDKSLS